MTSIILITGSSSIPAAPTLEGGGQALPSPTIEALGSGLLGEKGASFWRLRATLSPSTSYLVRGLDNGTSRELTSFTTAAGYDKTPGQAPVLQRLRLWRVRYPMEQVGAGGCVFSEYEGYIDLDYQDGSVPGTPSAEIVTVVSLQPKTGGADQSFVFAGRSHFDGAQIESPLGSSLMDIPDGAFPSPVYALWKPTLEPDREYCATLTLYGRNDQAMPTVISNSVCAQVTNMDARPGNGDAGVSTPDATAVVPADAFVTNKDALFPPADAQFDQPTVDINLDASPDTTDVSIPPADALTGNLTDARVTLADAAAANRDADAASADAVLATADAASAAADARSSTVAGHHSSSCSCNLGSSAPPGPLALLGIAFFLIRPARRRSKSLRRT